MTGFPNGADIAAARERLVIDAAFRAIIEQDWPALAVLQERHPHLMLDPGSHWTTTRRERFRGIPGVSTWNEDQTAYVVVTPLEQVSRWLGYMIAAEDDLDVVWHGTIKLPCGHCAAQFTVEEED